MSETNNKYTMKISRLTIDKLGIKMYDRVSAVLAELIANAYDADAENVTITLPFGEYLARKVNKKAIDKGFAIVIEDDGNGMTEQEVNQYYLNVGYNRRATRKGRTPKFDRRVMGRKGIGKLAPFGICHRVDVITAGVPQEGDGYTISHLVLILEDILEEKTDSQGNVLPYHPVPGPLDGNYARSAGTTLILRTFDRRRVPSREELHRQLAARFGLSQVNWLVCLKNSTGENETFELGTLNVDLLSDTRIDVRTKPLIVDGQRLPLSGWVAYAKDSYRDEVMAGVRLYARGKIVAQTRDFDIKSGFTGEFKMRSYLTGAITAEWLDEDEDLIQTDRQDIIWNSDYGNALREWGRELLKELAKKAETSTRRRTWDLFLEESRLEERLTEAHPMPKDKPLRDAVWRAAKVLITDADRDSIEDSDYRNRIIRLAYAIGPHHALLALLDEIASSSDGATDIILDLFEQANLVEIFSLGQVAYERVRVIEQLRRLVSSPSTVERDLQKLIEDAQWILYPDWTALTNNQPLESFRLIFQSWYQARYGKEIVTSAIGSPKKRPDFVMLNHASRLEILEIKRPEHSLTDVEFDRAFDYLTALREFINENVEVRKSFSEAGLTFICSDLNLSGSNKNNIDKDPEITRKTWHDLFTSSRRSHEDFLEVAGKLQGELPELPVEGK